MSEAGRPPAGSESDADRVGGSQDGYFLVMFAISITAVMAMIALVVDLGADRDQRRELRTITDSAAAAGAVELERGDGVTACQRAVDYLVVHLAGVSALPAADCDDFPASRDECVAATHASTASAVAGDYTVEVVHPVADDDPLMRSNTIGNPGQDLHEDDGGPCDRLGVRIVHERDTFFGGMFGNERSQTSAHTVARPLNAVEQNAAIALLLLELHDCQALYIQGEHARVRVKGRGDYPGFIHADSLGDGTRNCPYVLSSPSAQPGAIAERSETPVGNQLPGSITVTALTDRPDARPANAYTPGGSPRFIEPQGGDVLGYPVLGRGPVDARYLDHVKALRSTATSRFGLTPASAAGAGYTVYGCSPPNPTPRPASGKVYIDCAEFKPGGHTFEGPLDELVFNGRVKKEGPEGSALQILDARAVYVKGSTTTWGVEAAHSIHMNNGTPGATCTQRAAANRAATSTLVIGNGGLVVSGQASIRMCSTFVHFMDGTVPTTGGVPPYDNSFRGWFSISGQGGLDWTAPNTTDLGACGAVPFGQPCYDPAGATTRFEDLAVWTEAEGRSDAAACSTSDQRSCVQGQGTVVMTGVFFAPNANRLRLAGTGFGDIVRDAQLITRRLEVGGGAYLHLKPTLTGAVLFPIRNQVKLVR